MFGFCLYFKESRYSTVTIVLLPIWNYLCDLQALHIIFSIKYIFYGHSIKLKYLQILYPMFVTVYAMYHIKQLHCCVKGLYPLRDIALFKLLSALKWLLFLCMRCVTNWPCIVIVVVICDACKYCCIFTTLVFDKNLPLVIYFCILNCLYMIGFNSLAGIVKM